MNLIFLFLHSEWLGLGVSDLTYLFLSTLVPLPFEFCMFLSVKSGRLFFNEANGHISTYLEFSFLGKNLCHVIYLCIGRGPHCKSLQCMYST